MLPNPNIRIAKIVHDMVNKRTSVELSVTGVREALDTMCEGMIVVLRTAHKRGATNEEMQQHLNHMKLRVWNGVIDNLDNPDIHEMHL